MRICFILFLIFPGICFAQYPSSDTLRLNTDYLETTSGNSFSYNQLIIPAGLITVGVFTSINGHLDKKIKNQAVKWNGHTHIDDFLPFVSPATVYILNWSGIKGKHNFVDRSAILGTAMVLSLGPTYLMKNTISVNRPNGEGDDSFPSFHTAASFLGAEFMYQEFKDKSFWYGVAGYGVAITTGFLRIYNNKHWTSDVLVGAGLGILGTKAAYWLYPEIRKIYSGTILDRAMIIPFKSSEGVGFSLSASF